MVTFTGTNTYGGGTTINRSNLLVSRDANLGAPSGGLTLSNQGYLDVTASLTSARAISVTDLGGINAAAGVTATFSGVISGAGQFIANAGDAAIASTGTVVLSGQNTYTGGTNLSGGTLSISSAANLGTGGVTFYNSGTLATTANLNLSQGLTLSGNGAVAASSGTTATLSGVVSGAGSLSVAGGGTVNLTGANTYTGGTTIAAGSTLQGNTTSLQGAIADNGSLVFQDPAGTYAGVISGTGSVLVTGNGVTFSGTNTYGGGTTINLGDLLISRDANLGAASGGLTLTNLGYLDVTASLTSARAISVPDIGALNAAAGVTATFTGVVSGPGQLRINGFGAAITATGTVVLSGQNTYTGGTNLGGGTLSISSDANLGASTGSLVFFPNSTLATTANLTSARAVSLAGSDTIDVADGTTATLSGVVSGNGSLKKEDTGTLVLTGANTYAGGTFVNQGTLQGTTSGLRGNITDNSIVAFNQAVAGTFNGSISGTGAVTVAGGGTVTFAQANSYTGGTTVLAGGSLAGTYATLTGQIVDNGTLTLIQSGSSTASSGVLGLTNVTGTGTVAKGGTGTLTLTGNTSFGGTIAVASGSLNVADGASLQADKGVNVAGRLQLNGPGAEVSGGTMTVASGGTVTGTGTIANNLAVASGGVVSLKPSDNLIFGGSTNTNAGTIALGGGTLEFNNALANLGVISGRGTLFTVESAPGTLGLTNAGQLNFSGGFTDVHGLTRNNLAATITSGGAGVLTFYDGLTNEGTVNTVNASRTVVYGTESGHGSFTGTGVVELNGTILIDPAKISFGGDLVLRDTTLFMMEIGGTRIGDRYDSLDVAGLATLAGTLSISLIDGFTPSLGDSFLAVSYGSYSGMFATITGEDLGNGLYLAPSYTSNGLYLTVTPASVPEPMSVFMTAIGLVGAGFAVRKRAGGRALAIAPGGHPGAY